MTAPVHADSSKLPYRRGVGLCLFNAQGLVLVAERRDKPGAWQMPQGGVQKDEPLHIAALRELKEEIGTDKAEIIAHLPEKQHYDFPDWLRHNAAKISGGLYHGKYRGQEQDWFALRYLGSDKDIDLSGEHEPETPEFVAWKWVPLMDAPKLIVEFKRPAYENMTKGFAPLAETIKAGKPLPVWKA